MLAPMGERIPIATGFFIELNNGRAINRSREESEVLPMVLFWLRTHPGDERYNLVEQWVEQKEKQIEDDVRERRINAKRDEISAVVDRAARESKLRDRELIEIVRTEVLKIHGLSRS